MESLPFPEAKIRTSFAVFPDSGFYSFSSAVYSATNGNDNFQLTQALMPGLLGDVTDYGAAMNAAQGLGKVAVQIKNDSRRRLDRTLRNVAYSVIAEAQGSREKLLSSGFILQKSRSAAAMVDPTSTELSDGNVAGKMQFEVKGGRGLRSLTYRLTPDPITETSVWSTEASTVKKHIFEGLVSQKRYWAFVQIVGTNGQEYISQPVSRVAQ